MIRSHVRPHVRSHLRGVTEGLVGWSPSDIPQAEADALVAFWTATDGPNWVNYTWAFPATAGAMDGVTVSGGHVTEIELSADASISGDCSALVDLINLTSLTLYNTEASGDISGFSALTNLTYMRLGHSSVYGDVSGFSALTNLTYLHLYNTDVSGDVSGFSALVNLITLSLGLTSVEGDISGFSALTSLTTLSLNDTSVEYSGTMTNWNDGNNLLQDCGWSATEVDNFLFDLNATGVTDGTLNISGNNAAPTDGSVTGVDGLTALSNLTTTKGWDVTVTV